MDIKLPLTENNPRRKILLIYKSIQFEMFKIIFWSNFLTALVFIVATISFFFTTQKISEQSDYDILNSVYIVLSKFYWIYFLYLGFGIVFAMGLIIYAWLKISHMIAGPLFQIRTKLEKYVSTKEFEPIKLRKGDKINEIADLINQSIEMAKNTAKNSKNENIELRNWACRQDRTATFCMGK